MENSQNKTRRNFIKLAAGATVMAGATKTFMLGRAQDQSGANEMTKNIPPNERIQIATLGIGGQGTSDTRAALRTAGVELVAAADVYDGRLARVKEVFGKDVFTTRDYREVLARPDIDAVIIATPDHWHVPMAVDAMEAGKDVYVEKPMMHTIKEGHALVEAQRKTKRILQVGSQRVSSIIYRKAKELFERGAIGELNLIESWWNRNSPIGAWQYSLPPDASPQNIDWDRFLGKAPKVPFDPIRLFRWRNYRDYGTGVAGDLFVHQFSGIHYVIDAIGPTRVMSLGGLRFWNDGRDVPDVMLGIYDYPKTKAHPGFNLSLMVNFANGGGEHSGFRFVGSEGLMTITGTGVSLSRRQRPKEPGFTIDTFPKSVQEVFLKEYRAKYPETRGQLNPASEENYVAPQGYSDLVDHFAVFFDAVRTRKNVIEDAVFGMRAAGPALLSNVSYFENRAYNWNPETMSAKGA